MKPEASKAFRLFSFSLSNPASQPVRRANRATDPACLTEAATVNVKLLQSRQRRAPNQNLRQPRRHYAAPASSDDARNAPVSLRGPPTEAGDSPTNTGPLLVHRYTPSSTRH